MFYNKAKKKAIKLLEKAEKDYNSIGEKGNKLIMDLYSSRKSSAKAIDRIESYINTLANTPKEFAKSIAEVKLNIQDFHEAMRIEKENSSNNLRGGAMAAGGTAIGGGIAALGPSAAMAIATTFGTASTGTAIASLSGAAATNAALAWLGGGALAAGGGGMAAGNALLALAGPIGWGIAGLLIIGGGTFSAMKNKKAVAKANEIAIELQKKIAILTPKIKKLESLISETDKLKSTLNITEMVNLYPKDYMQFTEDQKQKLAALINNARSMGELINTRIS